MTHDLPLLCYDDVDLEYTHPSPDIIGLLERTVIFRALLRDSLTLLYINDTVEGLQTSFDLVLLIPVSFTNISLAPQTRLRITIRVVALLGYLYSLQQFTSPENAEDPSLPGKA